MVMALAPAGERRLRFEPRRSQPLALEQTDPLPPAAVARPWCRSRMHAGTSLSDPVRVDALKLTGAEGMVL